MKIEVAALFSCLVVTSAPLASAQTIPERAGLHDAARGPLQITVTGGYPTKDLPTLAAECDLIIEGVVSSRSVGLRSDELHIETTYAVQVVQVLSDRLHQNRIGLGTVIAIPHVGGMSRSRAAESWKRDGALGLLGANSHLVLFLVNTSPQQPVYRIYGPGAFEVRDGKLTSLWRAGGPIHNLTARAWRTLLLCLVHGYPDQYQVGSRPGFAGCAFARI